MIITTELVKEILYNSLEIFLEFDERGNLISINESGKDELGYCMFEADINDLLPRLGLDRMDLASFMNEVNGKELKTTVYRKNNTCFPAVIKFYSGTENNHNFYFIYMLNVFNEEQERKRADKITRDLKTSLQQRNQFVANIAHELRTPINGIKGHTENLYRKEEDTEKKKTLQIITQCCTNMEKIINQFLDYSKIESGKFEIVYEPFELRKCITQVIDTSRPVANDKGLNLSAYIDPSVPETVIGDELRLGQVLNNLVSNALKFTSIGSVNIEVYRSNLKKDKVELAFFVMDTGIGVGLQEKEKLFKSFSQADATITRQYGGTGLGLYVSKQLVELMNGRIDLDSVKGRGSTFSFTIMVGLLDKDKNEEKQDSGVTTIDIKNMRLMHKSSQQLDDTYHFGKPENIHMIQKSLEKINLCMDMDKWERAENLTEGMKVLFEEASPDVKTKVFRLQMSIRKENHDKCVELIGELNEIIEAYYIKE